MVRPSVTLPSPVAVARKEQRTNDKGPMTTDYFRAGCAIPRSDTGAAAAGFFGLGIIPPRSSCGRAITCTLITVPTRPAASAPASTAAFTAATSPFTKAVTMPLPALSQPIISTFAAFSIASVPSINATRPLVSSNPNASLAMTVPFAFLLDQFHVSRRFQIARVSFVGIDVHFQDDLRVIPDAHAIESHPARPIDFEFHVVPILHAVVGHVLRRHVYVS